MAGPYDYNIQQPDITGSLLGGIAKGQQIGAQQAAQDKAAMFQEDLQNYTQNPTARGASAMIAKYPEFQKSISASYETFDKAQKEDIIKTGTQAYLAIKNKRPDIALGLLDKRIEAAQNSGQSTTDLESLKNSIQQNPDGAAAGLALTMSSFNPDAWSKIGSEQREADLAPSQLSESQAKAQKAGVDAKFAESKAVQDLSKGGWEIQKLANDIGISRQNSQIAAINAATAREGNDLKKQELQLKLDEKIAKRDDAVRTKVAEITSARSAADNLLNTADRILQTPRNVVESAAGPISSRAPTLSEDTANFEELVNTLGSQTFLTQVQALKGMGALSEKEGDKIQNAAQNLSLRQSPEQLLKNVQEIQRLTKKGRDNLAVKYGVPDVIPDRPDLQSQPVSSGFKVLGVE